MTQIRPSAGAMSILEMNGGRLQHVQETPEVQEFKRELQARWAGRVWLYADLEQGDFAICAKEGEKEYVIFHTRTLNDQTIDRIYRADQASIGYEDISRVLEEAWDREEKEEEEHLREIVGDAGQRLAHAFKKDGLIDHSSVYGPKPKYKESRRAIRRGR